MKTTSHFFILLVSLLFLGCSNNKKEKLPSDIDKLNEASASFRFINIDSAINKASTALELSKKKKDYSGWARAYNNLAYAYFFSSKFGTAQAYIDSVRKMTEDYPNKKLEKTIADICEAKLFQRRGYFETAFNKYQSIEEFFENESLHNLNSVDNKGNSLYEWAKSEYFISNAVFNYYYKQNNDDAIKNLEMIRTENLDIFQRSYWLYAFADSYFAAITDTTQNYIDSTFVKYKEGLELLSKEDSIPYFLANNYEGLSLLTQKYKHSIDINSLDSLFNLLDNKYGEYSGIRMDIKDSLLPLHFLEKSKNIFKKYGDPYQLLAINCLIGEFYASNNQFFEADSLFHVGLRCDSVINDTLLHKANSPRWSNRLYKNLIITSDSFHLRKEYYEKSQKLSEIIEKEEHKEFRQLRETKEHDLKNAQAAGRLRLIIVVIGSVLLLLVIIYILSNRNRKKKDDLWINLSNVAKQITSKQLKDENLPDFIKENYDGIKRILGKKSKFLSFDIYYKMEGKDKLKMFSYEGESENVEQKIYDVNAEEKKYRPAIGCFNETQGKDEKWIFENFYFEDWHKDWKKYYEKYNYNEERKKPIHGQDTRSLIFFPIRNSKNENIGIISFQQTTTKAYDYTQKLITSFIARYIGIAMENARLMEFNQILVKTRTLLSNHFIRNVLSSIQSSDNDPYTYIADLGDLFEHSINISMKNDNYIQLKEDIEFLKKYIELNQKIYDSEFEYKIDDDKNEELLNEYIYPSILFPFIENSIKWGIRPLKGRKGLIEIKYERKEDFLACTIKDNGQGRMKAQRQKEKSHRNKDTDLNHGLGINSTRELLKFLFSEINIEIGDPVEIHDLDNEICGTIVIVKIPIRTPK
jgi:hypothetical protein